MTEQPADPAATPRAFLSHAHADKDEFVRPLARELRATGVDLWLDEWEIAPGDSLKARIVDEGLAEVSAVIAVLSPASVESRWVIEELDIAFLRRVHDGIRLIPVRLDGVEVPLALRHLLYIQATREPDGIARAAEQIRNALFNVNSRPPLGQGPAYTTMPALSGMTAADTVLLVETVREALRAEQLDYLDYPQIEASARAAGLGPTQLAEGLAVLTQRRLVETVGTVRFSLTRSGFWRGYPITDPRLPRIRQALIARLLADFARDARSIDHETKKHLAADLGTSELVVEMLLQKLKQEGNIEFLTTFGGHTLTSVSPALRRELDA